MRKDYSIKNLRKGHFNNENLAYSYFFGSDLRGADFTGSNLTGADFSNAKTGITPLNTLFIFLVALALSAISGYIAMLAGLTVQRMIASPDIKMKISGIAALILTILFIIYSWRKGGGKAIRNLLVPALVVALLIGLTGLLTSLGTGMGMLYLILANFLVAIMFVVGTVARAAAGTLSSALFIIVALGGSVVSKSVGGGMGTLIMAVACALISRRALSGAKGFEALRKVAHYITRRFGTSFRNAKLIHANFSDTKIRNTDFTNADVSLVNWSNSEKINCITAEIKSTPVINNSQ